MSAQIAFLIVEREAVTVGDDRGPRPGKPVVGASRHDDELGCLVALLASRPEGGQALVIRVVYRLTEGLCLRVVLRPVNNHGVAVADEW